MQVTKIRSSISVVKFLEIIQRKRREGSCDTHIICLDGYIPCHRYVLMANSPLLKNLILDNLRDIGHTDSKTIISLTFPDIKTAHMAHIVAMFYGGMTICKLQDLYYVMSTMKLIGIDLGDSSHVKVAKTDEINQYCKPRYYIDPDSDSEDETNSTTDAFGDVEIATVEQRQSISDDNPSSSKGLTAASKPSPLSHKPSSKLTSPSKSSSSSRKDCSSFPARSSTRSSASVAKTVNANDKANVMEEDSSDFSDMDLDTELPSEDIPPSPAIPSRKVPLQPKLTPISIKDLMNKQNRKRGRPPSKKYNEDKEKKSESGEKTRSNDKNSKEPAKKRPMTNSSNAESASHPPSESSEEEELSSDDSVVESVVRRSTLQPKMPESETDREPLRQTPMRKCRKEVDMNSESSSSKNSNDGIKSVTKSTKHVAFSLCGPSEDDDWKPLEVKCFFCSEIFTSEQVLGKHLSKDCGKHLHGKYSKSQRKCCHCNKQFPTLNLWGLIRHVNLCLKYRSPEKMASVQSIIKPIIRPVEIYRAKPHQPSPQSNVDETNNSDPGTENTKNESYDGVCSEEELQVVDTLKVSMVRLDYVVKKLVNNSEPSETSVPSNTEKAEEQAQVTVVTENTHRDVENVNEALIPRPVVAVDTASDVIGTPWSSIDDRIGNFFTHKTPDTENVISKIETVKDTPDLGDNVEELSKVKETLDPGKEVVPVKKDNVKVIHLISIIPKKSAPVVEANTAVIDAIPHQAGHTAVSQLPESIDRSVVAISSETSVQLFAPRENPFKPVFNPVLVANRFRKEWNEGADTMQANSTYAAIVQDNNQPSTSKAALLQSISPAMPLDYSLPGKTIMKAITPPPVSIPQVPAVIQRFPVGSTHSTDETGNQNSQSSVSGQEVVPFVSHIRNPKPGDRLYCGTVSVAGQNFRITKKAI